MLCLITAGPTYEALDQVRRLTNFSTGSLGIELARELQRSGHQVILLLGEQATALPPADLAVRRFSTTEDLHRRLEELGTAGVGAVFHVAAVSDFKFGKVWEREASGELRELRAGKLTTRGGPLLAELIPTPKLIAGLRSLFPTAKLVGWKYEVDGTSAQALAKAAQQLAEHRTDACVANGPAYGPGFGWLRPGDSPIHFPDRAGLMAFLVEEVRSWQNNS